MTIKGAKQMYQNEKQISSEKIFDGVVVKLSRDQVQLDDGSRSVREVITHPGGVCIVPVTENGEVIFVQQFRYPFRSVLTEVPAGKLEFGEDPRTCGIRELKEEVGAEAEQFTYLGCLYPTVAYDTEVIYMFMAKGLTFGEQHLDEGEFIGLKKIPLDKAYQLAMENKLPDAKTQLAIIKTYALEKGLFTEKDLPEYTF